MTERLGQEFHSPGFHRFHGHWNISMTGNEDDWNMNTRVSQLALEVQAVHSRKSHVQNKATGRVRTGEKQKFLSCPEAFRSKAHRHTQTLNGRTHSRIVIYHAQSWRTR